MVPRDDEHRNAPIRHSAERLQSLVRERWHDLRPIEDVACVHDEVHLAGERRLQRGGVIREEVVTTPPSVDARPHGEIEAEVGIGQQEDPDVASQPSASRW